MRATSCARCSRSICARTARPVGTSSNRRENGNDSIRVQRPGLPRRALYRGSRQEGGLDGCRCRARPHRPATPGCLAGLRRQARATDTLDADSFTARILAALDIKGWSDRSSYQIAAMRLADLIAPVSLMASPERTERGDRALYSYTCGRCGARVTVSVCTRCPSCGAPMVAAGHGAPVMKGAIHVDS